MVFVLVVVGLVGGVWFVVRGFDRHLTGPDHRGGKL